MTVAFDITKDGDLKLAIRLAETDISTIVTTGAFSKYLCGVIERATL
jgi:hypothetical protein